MAALRALSGLRGRLLAFNVLLVVVPVAGLLFLDTFERRLLADQERTMVEQARILSAALSEAGALEGERVGEILTRLGGRSEARLRVVDPDGQNRDYGPPEKEIAERLGDYAGAATARFLDEAQGPETG